ncbi:hypothetical protein GX586_05665 [bacterium]|nr:hypothetical protein [bacterium]
MNTDSKDTTSGTNARNAGCGTACSCTSGGRGGRVRVIIGAIVLVAATVLVARAIIKNNQAAPQAPAAGFAAPAAAQPPAVADTPATPPAAIAAKPAASAVKEIGTLAELNTVAAGTDAVFVFLPDANGEAPVAQMTAAAKTIGAQGSVVGIFTLKKTAPEYESIAAQVPVPCVLAMVKGRGAAPVSGDITETKLVQGFIAASSGGGCGPASAGCGPAGCN